MAHRIEFLPAAERDLKALAKAMGREQLRRLDRAILALAHAPRPPGAKPITGYPHHYRIREGDYRVVYEVQDKVLLVLVVAAAHRREVYEILRRRR